MAGVKAPQILISNFSLLKSEIKLRFLKGKIGVFLKLLFARVSFSAKNPY